MLTETPAPASTTQDLGAVPVAASVGWIRRLLPFLKPHRGDVALVFGAALLATLVTAALPWIAKIITDDAILEPVRPIAPLLVALGVLAVIRFGLSFVRRYFSGRLGVDLEYDLRNAIYDHMHRLDFARHDEMQSGQIVSRANTDVRIVTSLFGFLPNMSANAFLFVLSVGFMLTLSPLLTLVALVTVPVLFFLSMKMRKVVYPSSWDAQQKAAEVATVVEETASGVRVVKGFGQEKRELHRLEGRAVNLFGARMRNVRLAAKRQATMQMVPMAGQVAILAFGGWLALRGDFTIGSLLAFQMYLLRLVAPVSTMAAMIVMAQNARAGAERIFELLDSTPDVVEKPDALVVPEIEGEVRFDDVSFGYMRSEPVLDRFDLHVQPGERVALVGSSGSGKSTVALLLPRFYDGQEGRVLIDGHDIRDLTLDSLRSHIGVVFEESFLFSDTVGANIRYGRPDATEDEIVAAARAAEAHHFVLDLPHGYDTVVGERGLTLSGGQRQRIALARALLTDPRILILDDATSSIDVRIEEEIHKTLERLMEGRTTILIAHRRSTLNLADRIVVLDGGRVIDSGTYDELLTRCALFRELLAGPGDDLETADEVSDGLVGSAYDGPPSARRRAARQARRAQRGGRDGRDGRDGARVTADAWRQPDDVDLVIGAAQRANYAQMRGGGGGGGGGGMGGFGGMGMGGARLAAPPTEELMELIENLPPVRDVPNVDLQNEERPEPKFLFRKLLALHKKELTVALVLVSLNALGMAAGPLIIRWGIDHGVIGPFSRGSSDPTALWYASGVFVGVVVLTRILAYVNAIYTGRLGQHLLLRLRVRVFAHLQRLGLDYYEREMVGRIMTRMTSDIEALQSLLQTGFIQAMVHVVTFVSVTIVLLTMNVQLAGVFMLIVPPLAIATVYFRRSSSRAYTKVRDRIAAVNASFQESISGVRVTQAFVREGRNMSDFRDVASRHREARLEGTRISSTFFPFVEMLEVAATIIVLGFGSVLLTRGSLTEGALVAFALYITTVFAPIQQLSQVFDTYQQGRAAAEKLRELLGTEVITPESESPVVPVRLRGEITFDNVRFRYPGFDAEALSGVSLHVRPGETVALVGETGAGKSTVMKLVARFYDPTDGAVLIDGRDLRDLGLAGYRQQLGYVPQEAFLFTGTIRENIAYGRPDATDEEVEAAARAVGAHDFIARLPYGYHTPVVERGRSLSSGQKQLIALARAQLVDPAILLLDEATANLDLATEARVQRAMGMVSAGRTTILIAHRLQTAAKADRIIAIDHGHLVEEGTHDELLAAGGRYAELWSAFTGDTTTAQPNLRQ